MITVTLEGFSDLKAALEDLPKRTSKATQLRALKKVAQPIADDAQAAAPRRTGALAASITVSTKLSKRQKSLHQKADPGDTEVFVGAGPDPAAHLEEYGSHNHHPRPFMRPAWDRAKSSVLEKLAADMWTEIGKSAARAAKKAAKAGK